MHLLLVQHLLPYHQIWGGFCLTWFWFCGLKMILFSPGLFFIFGGIYSCLQSCAMTIDVCLISPSMSPPAAHSSLRMPSLNISSFTILLLHYNYENPKVAVGFQRSGHILCCIADTESIFCGHLSLHTYVKNILQYNSFYTIREDIHVNSIIHYMISASFWNSRAS